MNDPTVRFPVICPKCGKEQLDEFPIAEVAAALLSGGNLRLLAACHHYTWIATPTELRQIREYLGAIGAFEIGFRPLPRDRPGK